MKNFFGILRERETRWVLVILGLATLFRLWYCTYNDLAGDEAYYWLWSKHLDASYFSKGPAVAWTIAFGTWVAGDTVFGIRWLSVCLSLGTGWQLYWLARRLYSPVIGFWTVVAAAVTPLFALGSIIMTIDPLSVFFWVWSANLFLDALHNPTFLRWILLGLGVGSGFLAKYTNGLELLSFLTFLLLTPAHRRQAWSWPFLCCLLTFLLTISPVIWWNHQHHWITADHLKAGGHLDQKLQFSLHEFGNFLIGQALVISPLIFLAILIAVFRQGQKTWKETYLLCLFWTIFGFYAVLSLNTSISLNWPALAYIGGLVLAVHFWHASGQGSRNSRWFCETALGLALVMTILLHDTALLPLRKDPSLRLQGWKEWGRTAQTFCAKFSPDSLLVNDYERASELAFYLPGHPTTYIPNTGRIENQFSYWPSYDHGPGKKILYFTNDPIDTLPGQLPQEFSHIECVGQFDRTSQGRLIETYRVWLLRN